jgi:OTU domain-containing protein 6
MTIDELNELHKKQKKDLQAKIMNLKKSVTKGDKKKKKEADAQIEAMENDFELKCKNEIDELEKKLAGTFINSDLNAQASNDDQLSKQKISKAQKRKEKKEQEERDREKEIALQEIENQKGPTALELKKIQEKLLKKGLRVKDVKSDGNCMYYAVSDQLEKKKFLNKTWKELRDLTCDYMLKNPDQFLPYLIDEDDESGDLMDSEKYQEYCEKIRDTLVWGGQLELKALADVFGVLIEVVQNEGSELLIGNEDSNKNKERLIITYHRHMFGSGEHYNSTEPHQPENEDY